MLCGLVVSLFVSLKMNSLAIILLTAVWLFQGVGSSKVKAFALHPFFICCSLLFVLYVIGRFSSANSAAAAFALEKKLSLPLLPAILLSMPGIDTKKIHRLFAVFIACTACIMLLAILLAAYRYAGIHNARLFFYHQLVEPLHLSAITASCFCLVALVLLVEIPFRYRLKWFTGLFLTVCLLLLSSKLFLFLFVLLATAYIFFFRNKTYLLLLTACIATGLSALVFTPNPVKKRFTDLSHFNYNRLYAKQYKAEDYFDGLSMRLVFIRFSKEIIEEQHALWWGVGTGDAEDFLKQKIQASGMYTGSGHNADDTGYLKYGFHNQYLQILVQMGLSGLCLFVTALVILLRSAIKSKRKWFLAIWLIYTAGFFTDTWLELQVGMVPFLLFMSLGLTGDKSDRSVIQYAL